MLGTVVVDLTVIVDDTVHIIDSVHVEVDVRAAVIVDVANDMPVEVTVFVMNTRLVFTGALTVIIVKSVCVVTDFSILVRVVLIK